MTLEDAANGDAYFGEREAISLAFIYDGTVVEGTNTSGDDGPYAVSASQSALTSSATATPTIDQVTETIPAAGEPAPGTTTPIGTETVNAEPVSLYQLDVPNPITSGFDSNMTFDVDAVDVLGTLTSGPDFYTFQGTAGDLMNFEVKSAGLTRSAGSAQIENPIDSVLYVYGPTGQLVAWNDDQFEPSDSSIIDQTLPTTGTYTVEVDSFNGKRRMATTSCSFIARSTTTRPKATMWCSTRRARRSRRRSTSPTARPWPTRNCPEPAPSPGRSTFTAGRDRHGPERRRPTRRP